MENSVLAVIRSIYSTNADKKQLMYSNNESEETMIKDKTYNVINKTFGSVLSKFQNNLEKSVKCTSFIFDCVDFLYCRCRKVNLKRDGSYTDSHILIITKKNQ